jgi:hypothetical protein
MFLMKRYFMMLGRVSFIAWFAVLAGCSIREDHERVRAYVDSLIAHDLDTAVTLVCARSSLQVEDLRISLANFTVDEGKVTGAVVGFGRGSSDEAILSLDLEMNGSTASTTYLLSVEKEDGVWRACPSSSHPFGRPTS